MRKALLLVILAVIMAMAFVANYPGINVNNKFVSYAILGLALIFCVIAMCMRQQKLLRNLLLSIVGMTAFAFSLVPLYNVFCAVTGLNGKMDLTVAAATDRGIDLSRKITVEFVVNNNREMPWLFKAKHQALVVHPGELAATAYFASNPTNKTMLAQAIPSISPAKVSKYFKKVECFCFSSQKLGPGESASLGLRFYLDPDFPQDVQRVTLAYTLFDITK